MKRREFDELAARVNRLERVMQAVGVPTDEWVSPEQAGTILGTSRAAIKSEIDKAEYARTHGLSYDINWGTHYRKVGSHWQINWRAMGETIFLPPDQRPYLETD